MKCWTSRKYTLSTLSNNPMPSTNSVSIATTTSAIGIQGMTMLPTIRRITASTASSISNETSNDITVETTRISRGK